MIAFSSYCFIHLIYFSWHVLFILWNIQLTGDNREVSGVGSAQEPLVSEGSSREKPSRWESLSWICRRRGALFLKWKDFKQNSSGWGKNHTSKWRCLSITEMVMRPLRVHKSYHASMSIWSTFPRQPFHSFFFSGMVSFLSPVCSHLKA